MGGLGPGTLVLADAYFPGWVARVDGVPVPITRDKGFMRAVAIPPGARHVVFTYQPHRMWWGLAISIARLLLTRALLARPLHPIWGRIRRRVRPRSPSSSSGAVPSGSPP
ncbi:MAG TPA: hypothetical protein VNI34_04430 [Candidatus Nitrosotalea sp.]|nr:hypothetical protein [Candidatus Nitrosotalea sp.]